MSYLRCDAKQIEAVKESGMFIIIARKLKWKISGGGIGVFISEAASKRLLVYAEEAACYSASQ